MTEKNGEILFVLERPACTGLMYSYVQRELNVLVDGKVYHTLGLDQIKALRECLDHALEDRPRT